MKISNHKILITGGTSGIGEAMVNAFLRHNNQIIVVGRNKAKLTKMAELDHRIIGFQCDLNISSEIERLSTFIHQEHQDLNILINNAGIQYNHHFLERNNINTDIEKEVFTNFSAPIQLCSSLLSILGKQQESAIVNVSSVLGIVPKMTAPVYCGTKAGIHIFTKSLRYQLFNTSIKVFEIIPPLVDTQMTKERGNGKISPQQVVDEFIQGFQKNKLEIYIGKSKLLKLIHRFSPRLAEKIMKNK